MTAKHALFAEFQKKGKYGATMTARHGPPPRYAYKGLDSVREVVAEIVFKEMKEIMAAHGWLRD